MTSYGLPPSSPIDLDQLRKVAVGPFSATVLRNVWIPPRGVPDPFYLDGISGRFGTVDGTVYATDSAQVCWAEYFRNIKFEAIDEAGWEAYPSGLDTKELNRIATRDVPDLIPARAIMKLVVNFSLVADLTEPMALLQLHQAGFDPAHLTADGYGDCQNLARAATELGWNALKVPSAAWRLTPGWCLPIFAATTDLSSIHVEPVVINGRAILATAHSTTYKTGKRPTWLPPVPPAA